jgi:hypothetical protein
MVSIPQPLTLALIALAGGLVGALLQAALTRNLERSKFIRENRRTTYHDFLSALGKLSMYTAGTPEHTSAKAIVAESRLRIGLFGSRDTVRLLANLFENSASFNSPLDQHRLYLVVLAMRRDSVGHDDKGIKVDLMSLMFSSAGPRSNDD